VALRLATRGSKLALAQANAVAELLGGAEIVEASSDGHAGDKSRFVRGVELELIEGRADVGVHSAKDLPAELTHGLGIGAVPTREDPADAWVGEAASLDAVAPGARVGTASLRRRSQLLAVRPDLAVEALHGNVDTRLQRRRDGAFDAIVLAAAGLRRLGRDGEVAFQIPEAVMTPAAGQGILVLQARDADEEARDAAARINDERALTELTAERAVVALLDASCATPIGVHAQAVGGELALDAYVGLPDGAEWIRDRVGGSAAEPAAAGEELAQRLLAAGAADLLERAEAAAA
jgi:hydroxymethylbilane synthase